MCISACGKIITARFGHVEFEVLLRHYESRDTAKSLTWVSAKESLVEK